jgi:hypothetical protein
MREILAYASKRRNAVLAFSKATSLRVNGCLITDVTPKYKPPYLLETIGLRPKPPQVLLGDVYVARLAHEEYAFRLDIAKEGFLEQKIEAVETLLGNDVLSQLCVGHISCAHLRRTR